MSVPKPKLLSAKELRRALERLGFQAVRQKGSHLRMAHPDGRKTTIPVHSREEIGPWLLNRIVKHDLKMTHEEFEKRCR